MHIYVHSWIKNDHAVYDFRNQNNVTISINNTIYTISVGCGVPQGSILGPLFFILYINDVKQYIHDVNIGLYADEKKQTFPCDVHRLTPFSIAFIKARLG